MKGPPSTVPLGIWLKVDSEESHVAYEPSRSYTLASIVISWESMFGGTM